MNERVKLNFQERKGGVKRQHQIIALILFAFLLGTTFFSAKKNQNSDPKLPITSEALAAKFDYLSQHGNSSCSAGFQKSIPQMRDADHIQGSCCSPMSLHRYSEQVEGLKKYENIPEIPKDPYDIDAGLTKKLIGYYDITLTPEEQKVYDYAMENSEEKGPCCCKCWRWYVYGGLGKYLIQNYGFTGEQLTNVWNLSDGCGGDEEHNH